MHAPPNALPMRLQLYVINGEPHASPPAPHHAVEALVFDDDGHALFTVVNAAGGRRGGPWFGLFEKVTWGGQRGLV